MIIATTQNLQCTNLFKINIYLISNVIVPTYCIAVYFCKSKFFVIWTKSTRLNFSVFKFLRSGFNDIYDSTIPQYFADQILVIVSMMLGIAKISSRQNITGYTLGMFTASVKISIYIRPLHSYDYMYQKSNILTPCEWQKKFAKLISLYSIVDLYEITISGKHRIINYKKYIIAMN